MIIVDIKNLAKTFDDNRLFDHLNITIEEHQMVAICGKSGSGKSTLINMIGGLESYDDGMISIFGKNMKEYRSHDKRKLYKEKLGFLFQNYALIENETVKENMIIPIRHLTKSQQQEEIQKVLEKVGLLDKMDSKVYTLSGGEQQRVALARLLLKPCELILADEPTGNLDEENKEIVFGILRNLTKEKTVIIVTHDMSLAKRCDTIIHI